MTQEEVLTSGGKHPERATDPECTRAVQLAATRTAVHVSMLLLDLGVESVVIDSGFRTIASNAAAGGAHNSSHLYGMAVDIADADSSLKNGIKAHKRLLEVYDLYMEDPAHTPGWCHLTTRAPPSGNRIFIP